MPLAVGNNTIVNSDFAQVWKFAGTPSNGTTYANQAIKGALLVDTTGAVLYQNSGTLGSPTWTAVGTASPAELTSLLAAIPTTAVPDVAAANSAAAAGGTPTKTEFDVVVTEVNECKSKLNSLLAQLRTAGIVTP